MTLAVYDPNITETSPAGSCLLKLLRAAATDGYRLELFTAQTDLEPANNVVLRKMPVVMKPVVLQSITFTLLAILFDRLSKNHKNKLKISTQGGFPFCDISYAHCCHKLFLTAYRANITGGFLVRTARLLNHRWSAFLEAIAFQRARVIVVPSQGLADDLGSAYGPAVLKKLQVIPNPIAFKSYAIDKTPVHCAPFTFAFCALGNFDWKGLPLILQALATGISAQLQVIGGSPADIQRFRTQADSLNLSRQVTFVGMQSDIRPYLWSSDAFVFPSVYESFSLACLQAAAAGLALIATKLNGLEQLLLPGVSGWCVERTVESLTTAMRAAAANPTQTHEMGRNAQTLAQKYDEPAFQQRWLQLLSSLKTADSG